MKKTSATEMLTSAEPSWIENEPVTTAAAANSTHPNSCGVMTSDASDNASTMPPMAVIVET